MTLRRLYQLRTPCSLYPHPSSTNIDLGAPHTGQAQSSGNSSKGVPGLIPESGSPFSGSYTYPHAVHTYFFISSPLLAGLTGFPTGCFKALNIYIYYINYFPKSSCSSLKLRASAASEYLQDLFGETNRARRCRPPFNRFCEETSGLIKRESGKIEAQCPFSGVKPKEGRGRHPLLWTCHILG